MSQHYREIITKAVVGKGRKFTQSSHTLAPKNRPTSILGCWVINHEYKAKKSGSNVEVDGRYDINIWYSYNNNTKPKFGRKPYHTKIILSCAIKTKIRLETITK